MAATPFDIPAPGSSFVFDMYHDGHNHAQSHPPRAGPPPTTPGPPALPGGPCNYTDPTLPRCGCRRFWSRASMTASASVFQDDGAQVEVCMCSHHACFHEDFQPGQQTQQPQPLPGENQKPVTNRPPLSPVQLPSFHLPGSLGSSLDFNLLDFQASVAAAAGANGGPQDTTTLHSGQDSPMPDTYNHWVDPPRSQAGTTATAGVAAGAGAAAGTGASPGYPDGIPPIPAQCLMSPPPGPPSTAASSQARYMRPFAGRGLQTLSGVNGPRPGSHRLELLEGIAVNSEIPEPSEDPAQAGTGAEDASTPRPLPSQDHPDSSGYQKLSDKLESHEQRLDRLETNSFSIAGHDDCSDRHEHVDLRVTELESRVDEVEKILNDNGSVVSSRRTVTTKNDDATASVVSVSTNATVLPPSSRAEVYSQLQQLQAQVHQLQAAALPTYTKPWELEVVFLPFPLKGIWLESKEFTATHGQRRSIGSHFEGWTQLPNTISRATPDPQGLPKSKFQEWAGQEPDSTWLWPRAFIPGRVIDQRLRSRGLIKTVRVRGADARSVQLAVHAAFEDVLRVSGNSSDSGSAAPTAEFLGLRQAWVPLRKLHKDSRLRFLTPAEMATPALWDFTFLVSSVVMKATGVQRLYITQPEAYLQDQPQVVGNGYQAVDSTGWMWTWPRLRQLSRVYGDSQSTSGSQAGDTGEVPEADALEECWNHNERLDEQPQQLQQQQQPNIAASTNISLRQSILQRSSRRSSTEPSGQFYTGVQSPILSMSMNGPANPGIIPPSRSRQPSPLIQRENAPRDRKSSGSGSGTNTNPWPPNIRTGSLPPVHPGILSPAQSRRRLSSYAAAASGATPYDRRSSPLIARASPRPSPRLGSSHHHHSQYNHRSGIPIPNSAGPGAVPKRRFSRSPSLIPRNTPRWSRTSMSRSPSLAPGGMYGYQEDRENQQHQHPQQNQNQNPRERRMTTPFYYATPHSEAVPDFGYQRAGSRGPVAMGSHHNHHGGLRMGGYEDDDEELDDAEYGDEEMGDSHDDFTGSSENGTGGEEEDEDSEMTDHGYDHGQPVRGYAGGSGSLVRRTPGLRPIGGGGNTGGGSFGFGGTDGEEADLEDIDVYEDEDGEDELDGVDTDVGGGRDENHAQQQHQQQPLRPEDIPWAGIEDPIANGGAMADLDGDSMMSDGENVDPTSQSESQSGSPSLSQSSLSASQGTTDDDEQVEIAIHEDELVETVTTKRNSTNNTTKPTTTGTGTETEDDDDETSSQAPSEYSSKPNAWQIVAPPRAQPQPQLQPTMSTATMTTATTASTTITGLSSSAPGLSANAGAGFKIHEDGTAGVGSAAAGAGVVGEEELPDTQWE
ncbi:hypothetical protein B0J18DRAFT_365383 [Chaetomium sp. MPI-SDFR-AT-0129]|nr:hypothetical protein B0J18DRAFT_365383 [Chaetomium sp. MPI-SDFR-AT-0129]